MRLRPPATAPNAARCVRAGPVEPRPDSPPFGPFPSNAGHSPYWIGCPPLFRTVAVSCNMAVPIVTANPNDHRPPPRGWGLSGSAPAPATASISAWRRGHARRAERRAGKARAPAAPAARASSRRPTRRWAAARLRARPSVQGSAMDRAVCCPRLSRVWSCKCRQGRAHCVPHRCSGWRAPVASTISSSTSMGSRAR